MTSTRTIRRGVRPLDDEDQDAIVRRLLDREENRLLAEACESEPGDGWLGLVCDAGFVRKCTVLAHSAPLHRIDQRQAWQQFPTGLYDPRTMALAVLEAVVSQQGMEREATTEEVVVFLAELARRAAPDRDGAEHVAVARFVLRELLNDHEAAEQFSLGYSAEEQWNWAEQLEQYGLDPQLFKIQRDMNKGEGGITSLFRFATCEDFVNFLIGMVANTDGPIAAREALKEHADKLATRPDRETEGRFLAEAVLRLRPVQKGTAALTTARRHLEQQVHVVDRAAEHIAQQVHGLRQEAQTIGAEAEAAEREAEEAKGRISGQRTYVAALTAHVERLETDQAKRTAADRSRAVEAAQLEHEAWEAVEPLLALNARTIEAKETAELLARQDESRAPQRFALERAGALLHTALTQSLAGITADLEAAKAGKAGAESEAQESRSEHAAACEAAAAANGRAQDATRRRDEITALVASARAEGVLQKAENSDQALRRLRGARDSTGKQLADFEDRMEQARLRQGEIAIERQHLGSELGEVCERHTQVWDRIDDFRSRRRALAAEPRLKEVAGIDSNEPFDLDAVGDDLVGLLEDQCRAADDAIASQHAAAAEDRRVSRAVQDTGYLPAAPEVDRAVQSLRSLGAPALTGLQYLRDAVPAERHTEVIATHPQLAGGIVVSGRVPGDDLAALARRANVALTSVIAVAAHTDAEELLAGGPDRQHVVMPLHAGALDSDAADEELL
ncbi:hypothetical protein [Kitasatospora sp. NPDC058046]|uniref:hypothetical protein n=1 Tax=Kitasatospora sp. NPDC058046 TaxID=3346312 RepID=UPI0036DBF0F6